MSTPALRAYWRKQIRRITWLLAIWAIVSFGMGIFGVEALNEFSFGGIPFGFWMAQQGSIFVFIALILLNAILADRADREAGLDETAETTSGPSDAH
jgi:putative solute:sodium symporter small subunit